MRQFGIIGKLTSLEIQTMLKLRSTSALKMLFFSTLLRYHSFLILNFDFQFRQEVKVKLGSPSCKDLFTTNDLYNSAKIVNLPLAVVEI